MGVFTPLPLHRPNHHHGDFGQVLGSVWAFGPTGLVSPSSWPWWCRQRACGSRGGTAPSTFPSRPRPLPRRFLAPITGPAPPPPCLPPASPCPAACPPQHLLPRRGGRSPHRTAALPPRPSCLGSGRSCFSGNQKAKGKTAAKHRGRAGQGRAGGAPRAQAPSPRPAPRQSRAPRSTSVRLWLAPRCCAAEQGAERRAAAVLLAKARHGGENGAWVGRGAAGRGDKLRHGAWKSDLIYETK